MKNRYRTSLRGVQTATENWVRKDGKSVLLVGVMHVADAPYWEGLTARLGALEKDGHILHFEGIRKPPKDAVLTEDQKLFIKYMDHMKEDRKVFEQAVDLIGQHEGLKALYKTHTSEDVTLLDMFKGADMDKVRKDLAEREEGTGFTSALNEILEEYPVIARRVTRALIYSLPLISKFSKRLDAEGILSSKTILADRNEHSIQKIADSSESKHVLVWGAAHLEGMSSMLKKTGYKRKSRKWHTVVAFGSRNL